MINKTHDRHFFLIGGNVMTNGGSVALAKGQLGLFNTQNTGQNGLQAVSTLAGLPHSIPLVFKQGISDIPVTRSQSNAADSTFPFALKDIKRLRVSKPKTAEQSVDEVIIGYDGVHPETSLSFNKGDSKAITLRLSGEPIGLLGYPNAYTDIQYVLGDEPCDPRDNCADCKDCDSVNCKVITEQAINFFKNFKLMGGTKVGDHFAEITPVYSCADPAGTEEFVFYTLTICDTGDQYALSLVQAQYPQYKIQRTNRYGSTSVYQMLVPESDSVDDYEVTIASFLKGCENCPEGWDEVEGGILYAVTLEDDGADDWSDIETDLPHAIAGSVQKQGQSGGVGFYTVLVEQELTQEEIAGFVGDYSTATVQSLGSVQAVCENSSVNEVSWVAGETCEATTHDYEITLKDNNCGEPRLAELQAAYPDFNIVIKQVDSDNSSQTVTLTGDSGSALISILGEDYAATYDTSLTVTASNFVTSHATDLAELGIIVTSEGDVLTFVHLTEDFPTITIANDSEDLDGTLGDVEVVKVDDTAACQTTYVANVITNVTCEECDPIFRDAYVSKPPTRYDHKNWRLVTTPAPSDCLCGIRFKGKVMNVYPSDQLRDKLGFMESSVRIELAGGYITEMREGIGAVYENDFAVTYLQYWKPRAHVGGNLWQAETEAISYFGGQDRHCDPVARLLTGQESNIQNPNVQYADYAMDVERNIYSNSHGKIENTTLTYHVHVEVGRENAVAALWNSISGATGIPIEQG